jgi:hypothetical protein
LKQNLRLLESWQSQIHPEKKLAKSDFAGTLYQCYGSGSDWIRTFGTFSGSGSESAAKKLHTVFLTFFWADK